jgi:hypothetical protein
MNRSYFFYPKKQARKCLGLFCSLLICCLLAPSGTRAQAQLQIFSAGGTDINSGEIKGSFTLGEPVVLTSSSGDITLTQGFQQAMLFVVGLRDIVSNQWTVFPNPVENELFISFPEPTLLNKAELIAMNGSQLRLWRFEGHTPPSLSFQTILPGTYILRCYEEKSGNVFQKIIIKK